MTNSSCPLCTPGLEGQKQNLDMGGGRLLVLLCVLVGGMEPINLSESNYPPKTLTGAHFARSPVSLRPVQKVANGSETSVRSFKLINGSENYAPKQKSELGDVMQ